MKANARIQILTSYLRYGLILTIVGCSPSSNNYDQSSNTLSRIAFGSCASQEKPQPIWNTIVDTSPDLFLFIGDNIYGDTEDMSVMKTKYAKLAAKPGYQKLLKTCKVLSVWDDHDYGVNDGGVSYPKKKESEKVFFDFFNVDMDSPRRKRPGIYGAEIFGAQNKRVQIILLDTRYFKDTQIPNTDTKEKKQKENIVGWYLPTMDTSTTILGDDQWQWLEKQLQKDVELRVIVSSIQVIPYEKGMESWGNFPHERKRLFDLIDKTRANNVFFISGDVHFSEISKIDVDNHHFYDFTSSGLTNSNEKWSGAVNSFRLGQAYPKPNFGLINIDWKQKDPLITLQTIAVDGDVEIEQKIKLSGIN